MTAVKDERTKKIIRQIKVDINKCTGCRSCEMACSALHAVPKYSHINPARSRIRVYMDEVRDLYVPVRAGAYTQTECEGRNQYTLDRKEYPECSFCQASCPSRNHFKEPDSDLPLKCDMCANEPSLTEPLCVQVCQFDALTYEEKSEEMINGKTLNGDDLKALELACESLVKKHGRIKVMETFLQLSNP
jgi:benzoyl-CoA reductase subunit BamC